MTFNPFEMQKQMLAEFEKSMGDYMQKMMREPSFMQIVAKNLETTLDIRGVIKTHLERALKTFNIPTEDSMTSLYQTVHNLETRLLDLEEKVEELSERFEASRSDERTIRSKEPRRPGIDRGATRVKPTPKIVSRGKPRSKRR